MDPQPAFRVYAPRAITVNEDGSDSSSFSLMLGTEPLSAVTLDFASAHGGVTMTPSRVVLTHLNWNANTTISVQGIDDAVDQGDSHGDAIVISMSTEDALFDCLEADRPHCGLAAKYKNFTDLPRLNATVIDDDTAGVVLSAASVAASFSNFGDALELGEYNLTLSTQPYEDVVVATSGLGPYSAATPSTVTFTSDNWNIPQTIAVASDAANPIRPVCAGGSRTCGDMVGRSEAVSHTVTSLDPLFNGVFVPSVSVAVSVVFDETDPPKVTGGLFGNLLNSISVTFDQSTDRAELTGSFDCTSVVDLTADQAGTWFGAGSYCSFTSDTTFKIIFGDSATVVPGDRIHIKNLVVQSSLDSASLFATSQSFAVAQPSVPTVPSVALVASSTTVGRCDDLVLDGSSTTGSGGRDLTYEFEVAPVSGGSVENVTQVLVLVNAAHGGSGNYRAEILSKDMVPGSAFSVTLTATNFLGNAGSATAVVTKSRVPTPSIKIQGASPKSTTLSDSFSLQATAELPTLSCVSLALANSKMSFTWIETTGKFTGALSGTSKNPRVLEIAAGSLATHETFNFRVVGFMSDSPNVNNSASVDVVVAQQDVVARISGGASRQVGFDQSFTLDGTESEDPDASSTAFVYSWSCEAASDSASCGGFTPPSSAATAVIAAKSLPVGAYEFTLSVSKEAGLLFTERNDTATASVEIVAGSPPVVSVSSLTSIKYNTESDYVSLSGTVSAASSFSSVWSADDSDIEKPFVLKNVAQATVSGQLFTVVSLSSLTQGSSYTFRLTATDSSSASSSSTVVLTMNEAPSSGSVTVTPERGFALGTSFTYTALNWVDEDLPLTYIFGTVSLNDDQSLDLATFSPFGGESSDAILEDVTLAQGAIASNYSVRRT